MKGDVARYTDKVHGGGSMPDITLCKQTFAC